MTTWKEIDEFIKSLPEVISNDTLVQNFFKNVKAPCVKCQSHYNNYPRPKFFGTKIQVKTWVASLKNDINKTKTVKSVNSIKNISDLKS